ncbi:MAG: hypothetical protein IPH84_12835 [Bacteroidales bacterium]|nr:hypothetical protein [Bacteroidales bacterium]
MKLITTLILLTLLTFLSITSAKGQAGVLDPTFNSTGTLVLDLDQFDLYQDIKVQPDGKILAVGTSMTPSYTAYLVVSRFSRMDQLT